MKTQRPSLPAAHSAFTLVEVMIAMVVVVLALGLATSTFLTGLRMMYKDTQRLASNASLRSFMSHISIETLNASFFYVFPYYTSLDGSVDLAATEALGGPATRTQAVNDANDLYDRWIGHGDCLVLVTKTSIFRSTDIRQIRIFYRVTSSQTTLNSEAPLRYYETADWGEGTKTASNGHPMSDLTTELNKINLNSNPSVAGSKQINERSLGRLKPASTNRYPIFSTLSPSASPTSGSVSINVEFVNGKNANNMLSSSSFNYTISPRR